MRSDHIDRSIETIWRMEAAKIIGSVARLVRDLDIAEDIAHDAFVAALEEWRRVGIPPNPGAWLMLTARRRAIDMMRRRALIERKHEKLTAHDDVSGMVPTPDYENALDADVKDDLLRLMFIACHPVLPTDARVALTLRLVAGLTTEEIARAFLAPEATIAQRIVRAKRTLATAAVAFEVPRGSDREARVSSVCEVIYLVFNEGYAATTGNGWMRPELCEDALRLGRMLAELVPGTGQVHSLVALMEFQASRVAARIGPSGEAILLLDQDRGRWDRLLIRRGVAALQRAEQSPDDRSGYFYQASIAACHARATRPEDTDWVRIVALYEALARLSPSPVVELNRAVAVSMAFGPEAALTLLDRLGSEPALRDYHYLPSARGDVLLKLGRFPAARTEFERAASLARNARERELLLARARSCVVD
jgi:RNA polymerase sigma factor (sigma-70 family)